MSNWKPRRLTLAVIALLSVLPAQSMAQAQPACQGRDMLEDLRAGEPMVYGRLAAEAAATINTGAALWRVDKDGVAPSYLFGTAHLSDPRITTLTPKVQAALDGATQAAFEVADLSADSMAQAVARNARLFVYADGRQLDTVLPSDQFEQAASVLASAGMPREVAVRIKPWLVFMMLSIPECERLRQSSGHAALDMQLTAAARARGVPVIGLETIDGQLSALAGIAEDQQIAMLRVVLFHAARTEDQMETLIQLYLKRQMGFAIPFQHELARRAGVDPQAFADFERDILVRRNAAMLAAALPLVVNGGTFIAVGALHLVGDNGLVAALRQAGYTVTAVE